MKYCFVSVRLWCKGRSFWKTIPSTLPECSQWHGASATWGMSWQRTLYASTPHGSILHYFDLKYCLLCCGDSSTLHYVLTFLEPRVALSLLSRPLWLWKRNNDDNNNQFKLLFQFYFASTRFELFNRLRFPTPGLHHAQLHWSSASEC